MSGNSTNCVNTRLFQRRNVFRNASQEERRVHVAVDYNPQIGVGARRHIEAEQLLNRQNSQTQPRRQGK